MKMLPAKIKLGINQLITSIFNHNLYYTCPTSQKAENLREVSQQLSKIILKNLLKNVIKIQITNLAKESSQLSVNNF